MPERKPPEAREDNTILTPLTATTLWRVALHTPFCTSLNGRFQRAHNTTHVGSRHADRCQGGYTTYSIVHFPPWVFSESIQISLCKSMPCRSVVPPMMVGGLQAPSRAVEAFLIMWWQMPSYLTPCSLRGSLNDTEKLRHAGQA